MSILAQVITTGGPGGVSGVVGINQDGAYKGDSIASLTFWDSGSTTPGFSGMTVFTSGAASTPNSIGITKGNPQTYSFAAGERITSLYLEYAKPSPSFITRVKFSTVKPDGSVGSFDFTASGAPSVVVPCPFIPVGSGILVGLVYSATSTTLNSIGFVFLNPILSVQMTNIVYTPTTPLTQPDTVQLDQCTVDNTNGKSEVTFEFSGEYEVDIENTWTSSKSVENSVNVSVSANFFDVVKATTGYTWTQTNTNTSERSVSTKDTRSWSVTSTVPSGANLALQAVVGYGTCSLAYAGEMTIVTSNTDNAGNILPLTSTLKFSVSGTYSNVAFTRVDVTTVPIAPPVPPPGQAVLSRAKVRAIRVAETRPRLGALVSPVSTLKNLTD